MWIGALLLEVRARPDRVSVGVADVPRSGQVAIRAHREQQAIPGLDLRFPVPHDLASGSIHGHAFYLDRHYFDTPNPAADGAGHPPCGLEMASGISGHLRLELELVGLSAWPIDQIRVHVREYRRTLSLRERVTWELEPDWRHIGTFAVGEHPAPLSLAFLTRR